MAKNPALQRAMTKITGIGHKMQSKILLPYTQVTGDAKLYILKRNGRTKKYDILAVVFPVGISFQDEGYRTRTVFEYSTLLENFGASGDKSFGEIVGIATHVALVPNGDIFSITQGGEVQLMQTDFGYKILGQIVGDKFVLSENE